MTMDHDMDDNNPSKQPPRGPSQRPTAEQGRQGQNVRGMTTVLAVSVIAVIIGFVVVFVLSSPGPSTTEDGPDGPTSTVPSQDRSTPP